MSRFDFTYRSEARPYGADGEPQTRTVRGRVVVPPGDGPFPTVVVAHGHTGFMDWGFLPAISEDLAAAGIASLRFNFSGTGIGEDLETLSDPAHFRRNSYLHELNDLEEIHRRLHDGAWPALDVTRLGLLGHSRGAAMGIVHASEAGDYRALVTWAGMDKILRFSEAQLAKWRRQGQLDVMHWTAFRRLPVDVAVLEAAEAHAERLDIVAACRRLARPTLVVMGDRDGSLPFSVTEGLLSGLGAHGRLLRIDGGDHVFGAKHPLIERPETLRMVLSATVEHFRTHLSENPSPSA